MDGARNGVRSHQEGLALPTSFNTSDLERAKRLHGENLDVLPFGVIVVDKDGTVVEYNAYEREMADIGARPVIGLNFFRDIAPCTAIQEFQGRFREFLTSHETSIEPFEFLFPFKRGPQNVTVVFVRLSNDDELGTICVMRTDAPEVTEKITAEG